MLDSCENGLHGQDVLTLRGWLDHAGRAVFFGGAGVSTESGIPDFRSSTGLYRTASGVGYPAETVVSHDFFWEHPEDFWKFYMTRMVFPDARPNACHRKLAELARQGRLAAIVTQNIDGLHQKAGSDPGSVLELHGAVARNSCTNRACGARYTLAEVVALYRAGEEGRRAPRCPVCGAPIKPDVVLYGEALDESVMLRAAAAIEQADVVVVAGTSLAVWPAAGLLGYYRGSRLAVVNLSATPADPSADLVIHEKLGEVFSW